MTAERSIFEFRSGQVWKSLGLVDCKISSIPHAASHAAYPAAVVTDSGKVRVFFSTRNVRQNSFGARLDLEISGEHWEVTGRSEESVLMPGKAGAFDADGAALTSVVAHDGRLHGFYLGWNVLSDGTFANLIGHAVSSDGGESFVKSAENPIIRRSRFNPLCVDYPFVIRQSDGWRMYYGSVQQWSPTLRSVLKSATSQDLQTWQPGRDTHVDLCEAGEMAISRSSVLPCSDGYSMWYARRYNKYRLGFAVSRDGIDWERADEAISFEGQRQSWESEERTYPFVFDTGGRVYMLYNGNRFGRDGFGLAILQQ